ncbi:MAG: hypothetical protein LR008_00040, partial [Candidatus Pacebacteria bacterium]|nr:hypothetical protein [Candidatus Paceibacterota bacterium]
MKRLLLYIFLFLLSTQAVFAQSETFKISIFGGNDITPPTPPTLLTINPIATTQIDITWSASTDNFSVGGYSVLKNSVPVATTTLLSYSDTGLTASTSHTYAVRAFDLSFNYSTTSNSLSTTTPDNPPPPAEESATEGTAARVVIGDLVIEEGFSTTSLLLTTARPARIEVRWGRTISYELGYVVNNSYSSDHAVLLTDLEPGTAYKYEIIGYTLRGNQSVIRSGSFMTLSDSLPTPPSNASRFLATNNGDDVRLSWQVPQDANISHVRIVRSHLGFPRYPQDGAVVYQGSGDFFIDSGVLNQYSPVYYTAFVYDVFGNVSSGAVAIVYAIADEVFNNPYKNNPDRSNIGGERILVEKATSSVNTDRVTPGMKMPRLSDIALVQKSNVYSLHETDIKLNSQEPVLVKIPKKTIAGNLKSIIATFVDPIDGSNSYSYLLRINNDNTVYEAVVPAFGTAGRSQVIVEIYDYEAFVVGVYQAPVTLVDYPKINSDTVFFPDVLFQKTFIMWALLGVSMIILIT